MWLSKLQHLSGVHKTFSPEMEKIKIKESNICTIWHWKQLPLSGSRLALGNQRFPVWVWLLAMYRGKLSAVIAPLMPKCLWSKWKWWRGLKKIVSPFPCCLVNRECLWKKTHIEKKIQKPALPLFFKQNAWFVGMATWSDVWCIFGKQRSNKTVLKPAL